MATSLRDLEIVYGVEQMGVFKKLSRYKRSGSGLCSHTLLFVNGLVMSLTGLKLTCVSAKDRIKYGCEDSLTCCVKKQDHAQVAYPIAQLEVCPL